MLGKRIKNLREMNGISQKKLAERLNLSQQAIAMWETEKREPDIRMLNNLCEVFDVDINYLLGKTNIAKPTSNLVAYELTIEDTIKKSSDLSEESRKDLLKQLELLKMRDKMKKMNEEAPEGLRPRLN